MVECDPGIIDELADDLYIQGNRLIIRTLLAGVVGVLGSDRDGWRWEGKPREAEEGIIDD